MARLEPTRHEVTASIRLRPDPPAWVAIPAGRMWAFAIGLWWPILAGQLLLTRWSDAMTTALLLWFSYSLRYFAGLINQRHTFVLAVDMEPKP